MRNLISILGCAALFALASSTAKADTVFNVSGESYAANGQSCGSTCAFSGTMTVDTSAGTIDGLDISFFGLSAFTTLHEEYPGGSDYVVAAENNGDVDLLTLRFTTTNSDTLVGFQGGSIESGTVSGLIDGIEYYSILSGTISAAASPTPEPSSIALLATGILGFAGVLRKRFA